MKSPYSSVVLGAALLHGEAHLAGNEVMKKYYADRWAEAILKETEWQLMSRAVESQCREAEVKVLGKSS